MFLYQFYVICMVLKLYFYFYCDAQYSCLSRFKIVGGELYGSVVVVFGNKVDVFLILSEALDRGAISTHKTGDDVAVVGVLLLSE